MMATRTVLWSLLVVVAVANGNPVEKDGEQVSDLRTEVCDTCLWLVNTTEIYLNNTETKRTIIDFLNAEVCTVLPGDMALQCQTLSTLLVPKVVEYIVDNFDSTTVCKDAGVCPASNDLVHDLSCPLCQFLVNSTVQNALDPQVQAVIHRQAHAACALLQPHTVDTCRSQVDSVINQVDSILSNVNSTATCTQLQLCHSDALGPLFRGIKQLMLLQQDAKAAAANAGSQYCEACQIAVMELAAIVADPNLQAQITAAAKSVCSMTGQWQSQCSTYVDTYAPVVFNVALMYLKPEQMCQQIMHVCPTMLVM